MMDRLGYELISRVIPNFNMRGLARENAVALGLTKQVAGTLERFPFGSRLVRQFAAVFVEDQAVPVANMEEVSGHRRRLSRAIPSTPLAVAMPRRRSKTRACKFEARCQRLHLGRRSPGQHWFQAAPY